MKNYTNKADSLQGISNTATIESLKEYEKTILELQQTYKQTLDSMLEAAKNYQNKAKDNNPYAQALAIAQKEQEELNANVGYYKDAQEKRLNVDRWYIQEYNKIMANKKGMSADAEVPGTQEQLALLKGGERILSPGENASYNSGQGSSSPIVLNNFNVKAWDSKDVKKYLLENRQLLNQITFQGIKDNNAQLRHMVRNA